MALEITRAASAIGDQRPHAAVKKNDLDAMSLSRTKDPSTRQDRAELLRFALRAGAEPRDATWVARRLALITEDDE